MSDIAPEGADAILMVCEGNVCRSPYLEHRLRQETAWPVSSAGTRALVGHAMESRVAAEVTRRGGDPSSFAARELTRGVVDAAGLVLTATREQRAVVVQINPRAMAHTFVLADFADLASAALAAGVSSPGTGQTAGQRLAHLVWEASRQRPSVRPRSAEDAALVDPWKRGDDVHAAMVEQAEAWLVPVVGLLTA